ncbi:MAG: sulfite exporter TauE/SafE family protein [Desulfobulbaceae bacterium]|nr:sulfite exporter TauE/SafE family protein [Desulfobulbaceae bacterium]
MLTIIAGYCAIGAVAGVLAGLLGIGGGLVIVPVLIYTLTLQRVEHQVIMHMALATSMASIIFTSISSFMAHSRRGAVRWDIVKTITPGILVGTFLGSCVASAMPTLWLKAIFVVFLYTMAWQMLARKKPKAARELPGTVGISAVGGAIGVVSSLVGIGGGSLSVPFMLWCNVVVHHAIGTSAAIGLPIAVAGTIGYVWNGWGAANLPPYALGYVYLPACLGIVAFSMLTAPLGVRLAHRLPVDTLKRVFATLLLVLATKMLWELAGPRIMASM